MATINQAVREHQTDIDWKHKEVVRLCWAYFDRFRIAFFPELPDCFLRCEPADIRQKLAYHGGDNGVGAQFEMVLNCEWVCLPRYQVAALILHGMIHMHQQMVGRPSTKGYHNRDFQERSRQLGIVCLPGQCCEVVDYENPFRSLVMEADADAFAPVVAGAAFPVVREAKMKKWSCACSTVRAATEVELECKKCGQPLTRQG
jgi:hypothetical protein